MEKDDGSMGKEATACLQAGFQICKAFLGAEKVEQCLRGMQVLSAQEASSKLSRRDADEERKRLAKERQVLIVEPV